VTDVSWREQGVSGARRAGAPRTPNTVDEVLDAGGEIIVHDVLDVLHVCATCIPRMPEQSTSIATRSVDARIKNGGGGRSTHKLETAKHLGAAERGKGGGRE